MSVQFLPVSDICTRLARKLETAIQVHLATETEAPVRVAIGPKGLTKKTFPDAMEAVMKWRLEVEALTKHAPESIEWKTQDFGGYYGSNRIPIALTFPTVEALATFQRSGAPAALKLARARFDALAKVSRDLRQISQNWRTITDLSDADFDILCRLLTLAANGEHQQYTKRSLDIDSMDSKWIERHARLLGPCFKAIGRYDPEGSTLEARLGFATADNLEIFAKVSKEDAALPYRVTRFLLSPEDFDPGHLEAILLIENRDTFERHEPQPGQMFIWSQGYAAVKMCRQTRGLEGVRLFYWGDCDSHGYHILALCRQEQPHIVSILMDRQAVAEHFASGKPEPDAARRNVSGDYLTASEKDALAVIQSHGVRIEQEHFHGIEPAQTIAAAMAG